MVELSHHELLIRVHTQDRTLAQRRRLLALRETARGSIGCRFGSLSNKLKADLTPYFLTPYFSSGPKFSVMQQLRLAQFLTQRDGASMLDLTPKTENPPPQLSFVQRVFSPGRAHKIKKLFCILR